MLFVVLFLEMFILFLNLRFEVSLSKYALFVYTQGTKVKY